MIAAIDPVAAVMLSLVVMLPLAFAAFICIATRCQLTAKSVVEYITDDSVLCHADRFAITVNGLWIRNEFWLNSHQQPQFIPFEQIKYVQYQRFNLWNGRYNLVSWQGLTGRNRSHHREMLFLVAQRNRWTRLAFVPADLERVKTLLAQRTRLVYRR